MFLERLADYGRRLAEEDGDAALPPMYQRVPIRYIIKLATDGTWGGMVDTQTQSEKRGIVRTMPSRKRAYAIRPKLLADNGEYTLGIAREGSNRERVSEQHRAFIELVADCARATGMPELVSVHRFLTGLDLQSLNLPEDFDPSGSITFEVDGRLPTDSPAVREFWAEAAREADPDAEGMQCLVCGQVAPCPEMLPVSIKGIPGGQTSGMQLVSANSEVFESYGLRRGQTSPICEDCGLLACNALNRLLRDEDTRVASGPLVYVFWTREPVRPGFNWGALFSRATPDDVRTFLSAPWSGKPETVNLDVMPFYAAALSAASARVIVRDWVETTLGEAQRHMRRYFRVQRLVGGDGAEHYVPVWQLARATVNTKAQKEQPAAQVVQAIMHLALHGGPFPEWLLFQAVRRTRAEQGVKPAHAALIKMVLLTQPRQGDEDMDQTNDLATLDVNHPQAAYHCGRLLAEFEAIQEAALGNIGATVVDRYFGTASSAPASVFGRLLRGAQPHMSKLHRDKPGLWRIFDERLREIISHIQSFPTTLTLRQQGLFALGYYHQRAADQQERAARSQARKVPAAIGAAAEPDDIE